jgi:hypothetical protein
MKKTPRKKVTTTNVSKMSSLCFNQNSRNLDNVEDFPVQVSRVKYHRSFSVQGPTRSTQRAATSLSARWFLRSKESFNAGRRPKRQFYFDELSAKAKAILDTEDIQLPTGELLESGGRLSQSPGAPRSLLCGDGRRRQSERRDYELHVERMSLFTPINQDFHHSRHNGSDDPHQDLVVVHMAYLVDTTRHVKTEKLIYLDRLPAILSRDY